MSLWKREDWGGTKKKKKKKKKENRENITGGGSEVKHQVNTSHNCLHQNNMPGRLVGRDFLNFFFFFLIKISDKVDWYW